MTPTKILTSTEYKKYFDLAISYDAYIKNFADEIALGDKSKFAEYLPQNWSRQSRLDRKLKLRPQLLEAVRQLPANQKWLVITEHWCGDASQINPIIAKAADLSDGKIELRFIYRDQHEELIDAHLTDGRSRAIPILLKLDNNYDLLGSYGPRPPVAQKLVKNLLSEGLPYAIPLHTWYAKDKQQSVQDDLLTLVTG